MNCLNHSKRSFLLFLVLGLTDLLMVQDIQGQPAARANLSAALSATGYSVQQNALDEWKTHRREFYRQHIQSLPDSIRRNLLAEADEALTYTWPVLPASSYLEYRNKGIRTGFEQQQDERRKALCRLVVGQLIAGDDKYLSALVDGLWATLEESTWEIPAIVVLQKAGAGLPDPAEQVIGLVSAETGVQLSAILFLLQNELDRVSPQLARRINTELRKRIIEPYLTRNDFWWMGFRKQAVNNWNVWINQNIFQTVLFAGVPADTVNAVMQKVFRSTDFFIDQYPEDGGCEEGPAYWSLAGGKLIRLLELANNLSGGQLNWSGKALLHRMGSYIAEVHIAGNYFVNFADATPVSFPNPEAVYQYGRMFKDAALQTFAGGLQLAAPRFYTDKSITDFLETAGVYASLVADQNDIASPDHHFFPNMGVYTMRSRNNQLYAAVQAGNNGESHNHNDVGNFIVYAAGKPVIVDAGVGVYTAKTFSESRYDLWNMQSQWHNCPTINGVMQQHGKSYAASAVAAVAKGEKINVSMDISKAYPAAASVQQWKRAFLFDRNASKLVLNDQFRLTAIKSNTSLHFMSRLKPVVAKKGWVELRENDGRTILVLKFNPAQLELKVEEKAMDDQKLKASWGEKLYRLTLTFSGKALQQQNQIEFIHPLQ